MKDSAFARSKCRVCALARIHLSLSLSRALSLLLSLYVCQYMLARANTHLEEEEVCDCSKGIGGRVDRVRGTEDGKCCLIVSFFIPSVCVCVCVCV